MNNSGMKWEFFCDESFYHMWAVRPVGDTSFESQMLFHVSTSAEAKTLKDQLESPFHTQGVWTDDALHDAFEAGFIYQRGDCAVDFETWLSDYKEQKGIK